MAVLRLLVYETAVLETGIVYHIKRHHNTWSLILTFFQRFDKKIIIFVHYN